MSTLKVNEVRHLSNSGTENIKLESNGTTTLQATSTLGLTVTGTLNVSGLSTFTVLILLYSVPFVYVYPCMGYHFLFFSSS